MKKLFVFLLACVMTAFLCVSCDFLFPQIPPDGIYEFVKGDIDSSWDEIQISANTFKVTKFGATKKGTIKFEDRRAKIVFDDEHMTWPYKYGDGRLVFFDEDVYKLVEEF